MKQQMLIAILTAGLMMPVFANAGSLPSAAPVDPLSAGASDMNGMDPTAMADNNSAALPDAGPDLADNSIGDKLSPTDDMD